MITSTRAAKLFLCCLIVFLSSSAGAQTQTSGCIKGTVTDAMGALVSGAEVRLVNRTTGELRNLSSSAAGNYSFPLLPVGHYHLSISAPGFKKASLDDIAVSVTETVTQDVSLEVGATEQSVNISVASQLIQSHGPQLGRVVDSRSLTELPLATRNFTHILWLSPGTSANLYNNTAVGRNSQTIFVNGIRATQNDFRINGADANIVGGFDEGSIAVPAPETIQEFKIQTSLYDASFGRSGGNIQIVTRSGGNDLHGSGYEFFRNQSLNANSPVLKAAGVERPVLERNVFGGTVSGPVKKGVAFYFLSYQGTRELNGSAPNSLSSNVLIDPRLTDDRSELTLKRTFNLPSIHPTALALLNVKLPSGNFLIPTPQANGRYSGSAPSTFSENQFNTNFDYRLTERDWLAAKVFSSNAPATLALFNGPNVPGFGAERDINNRAISLQHVHTFSSRASNEARIAYGFIRYHSLPQEPVTDSEVGIFRVNAGTLPGLGLMQIAPNSGGVVFGTPMSQIDVQSAINTTTATDTLSITRGKHFVRVGAELMYFAQNVAANFTAYGRIDFASFETFLRGNPTRSMFGTGINYRSLRATGYRFFVQDDWRLSRTMMLNLGVRYDLELPAFDTRGRLSTFDPELYKPRNLVDETGMPIGPPIGGFVQAGNVIAEYDSPEIPNVDKRLVKSVDKNNLGPRIGIVFSPFNSGRLVMRSGYGMYHSWLSTFHLSASIQIPPNYVTGQRLAPPLANPYFLAPPESGFPTLVEGIDLSNQVFGRDLRSPYVHQYNASLQYALKSDLLLEIAYVGTRGLNIWRNVAINQAPLASEKNPIYNEVTGTVFTTNTPLNARLRAPFQGVLINGFGQRQTTAQSSYNSLQASLTKQLSRGLQFLASYTYARSIDNASTAFGGDSVFILGNQHDNRANRGVSDSDRTHRLVFSYLWDLPNLGFAQGSRLARSVFANWQVAGIIVAMSGLPIDIVDAAAGDFYGLSGATTLARPNFAPGATRETATNNVPAGYFFNPFAFARPIVLEGQLIPSSGGKAVAGARGTDIGELGRNILRGPRQVNVDFSVIKRFPLADTKTIEFRAEFFNLFNQVNLANPNGNFNAIPQGSFDLNTGQVINPGSFGRITGVSNNPRLIQLAMKFSF